MGLPEAQLFAVRDRTLEIRCRSVRLTQCGVDAPRVVIGQGLIRMHADGSLELTTFVQQVEGPPSPEEFVLGGPTKVAEFVPASDYYEMEATADDGGRWVCRRAYPVALFGIGGVGSILPVELPYLTRVFDHLDPRYPDEVRERAAGVRRVVLQFVEEFTFPANIRTIVHSRRGELKGFSSKVDAAQLDACGLRIYVARESGVTTLVASSEAELAPGLATHLADALGFILGRPVRADVEEVRSGGAERVTVYPPRRSEARVTPPVPGHVVGAPQHAWALFSLFLAHLLAEPSDDRRPLAGVWHGVLNVGGRNVEAMALVWSAAVESLLALTVPEVTDEDYDPLVEWRQVILDALAKASCSPDALDRIGGLLKQLDRPQPTRSPKAQLRRLVREGAIRQPHYDAWATLRPLSTHGALDVRKDPQLVVRDTFAVLALLYRLVFRAVGYSGPFRDAV